MHGFLRGERLVGGDAGEDGPGAFLMAGGPVVYVRFHADGFEEVAQHYRVGAAMVARTLPDVDIFRQAAREVERRGPVVFVRLVALAAEDAVDLDMLVGQFALRAVKLDLEAFPGGI